ncbi:MAG: hypothetical protein AB3N10_05005 [Allomuricauda sp.]
MSEKDRVLDSIGALITRRSQVRVLFPLLGPKATKTTDCLPAIRFFMASLSLFLKTGATLLQPAIIETLDYKEHVLSPSSYSRFKSRTQQFAQWAHNNTKADLSSLFQFFGNSGHIPHNFVKGILKRTTPFGPDV